MDGEQVHKVMYWQHYNNKLHSSAISHHDPPQMLHAYQYRGAAASWIRGYITCTTQSSTH